jgi:predicted transcriptional regulator
MTTKQRAVEIISRLPDEATITEIMEELYVQMKVERGLQQVEQGELVEHSQVKERLAKWLE